MKQRNTQVILRLFDAIMDHDRERVFSFFGEHSEFNTFDPVVGQQAIWRKFAGLHERAEQFEWRVDEIREDEQGDVFTQRTARYLMDGDWREVKVEDHFEISGSKILAWHDRYDHQQAMADVGP